MRTITDEQIEQLIQQAAVSERGRVPFRLHEHHEPVQRMVNAIVPGSYVTPHVHRNPPKTELMAILKGKVAIIRFSEDGDVSDIFVLDESGPIKVVDIRPGVYHNMVALEPSAVLEIIQGPYHADTHKQFANWAPQEGSPEAKSYLQHLIAIIKNS